MFVNHSFLGENFSFLKNFRDEIYITYTFVTGRIWILCDIRPTVFFFLIYGFYVLGLLQVSKVNCRGEARGPAARWSSVAATAGCTVECADSTQLVPVGPRTHQDRVIDSLLGSDPRLILCVKFQVVSILLKLNTTFWT